MSEKSPKLSLTTTLKADGDEKINNSLFSRISRNKGMISAVLLAAGIMFGCDKASCNFVGCEVVSCSKNDQGNVSCNGCSGCEE